MVIESIYDFGVRMAREVCDGADHNSATICEYEGWTSTQAEIEFCNGWNSIISLTGEVAMHQMLYRIKAKN